MENYSTEINLDNQNMEELLHLIRWCFLEWSQGYKISGTPNQSM